MYSGCYDEINYDSCITSNWRWGSGKSLCQFLNLHQKQHMVVKKYLLRFSDDGDPSSGGDVLCLCIHITWRKVRASSMCYIPHQC